ncbi:MAG: ubiquinol-cytochrome c reductase iron-sulfur subunit [Gammaproteobacteria bacterium]|nr:ubiquinol-cytochrome c reductase iron-sulfur subunit [Gammaproteobacteria bacterium]
MSNDAVDTGRRRFLTAATGVVGAIGGAFVAYPFLASWKPSAKAQAAGAPVQADISKLQVGERLVVEWRGQPIWIVRRPDNVLKNLDGIGDKLKDPESAEEEQQPAYAKNAYRSIKPEYAILIGICTHLGCSPLYQKELNAVVEGVEGGFFCPCHGSRFDLAGRVFSGVPAQQNLRVPPHKFLSDTQLMIGVDQEAA